MSKIKFILVLASIMMLVPMFAKGVSLERLAIQLLQKVEERTLYIIQQDARIAELENNQNK